MRRTCRRMCGTWRRRAVASFDHRHRFVGSVTYALPDVGGTERIHGEARLGLAGERHRHRRIGRALYRESSGMKKCQAHSRFGRSSISRTCFDHRSSPARGWTTNGPGKGVLDLPWDHAIHG